jgi:hypothetical protein
VVNGGTIVVVNGGAIVVVVVVVVVMVVAAMTDLAGVFLFSTFKFRNGLSNDGCDGSSSKNECNGKFDLNHF